MYGRFIKAMTTGAIIGAAASMMIMPDLDRETKKRIRRSRKMIGNAAGDLYDNVRDWMR